MKRRVLGLGLAAGVLLLWAGVARADGPQNLAAGTGTLICCGQPMVHVNAQSDQGGVSPQGHFWIRYPNGVEFGGRVVCLSTVGNTAGLTGRIDLVKVASPTQGFVAGNFVQMRLIDNGSPGTADVVNFDVGSRYQLPCQWWPDDLKTQQGNYVVHDEPVLDLSLLNSLLMGFESEANDPYGMNG